MRGEASGWPPPLGTSLALGNHTYLPLTFSNNISIHGRSTNIIYLASDGHVTLLSGDSSSSSSVTFASHFSLPRVAMMRAHIHPTTNGGTVFLAQLSNRVAITFNRVVEYGTGPSNTEYATPYTNSFQAELFYDGRIRMTHLAIGTTTGIAGLSAGNGLPPGFVESDLTSYGTCALPIAVTVPPTATEGDGVLFGQGLVNLFSPAATNVTMNLTSSDNSEVMVPADVTILAGQTSATFDVTILDDSKLDGRQVASISVSAPGYAVGTDTIQVNDNETAALSVILPASATEGGGSVQGTVAASAGPTANIAVSLRSSDTTEIQVPPLVVLPAGQTSVVFTVTIVNDTEIDGDQTAMVTASVPNWTDGSTNMTVTDDESPAYAPLRFSAPRITAGDNLQLLLGRSDGSPITPDRAAHIQFFATTNVTLNNWVQLTNVPFLTNGQLQLNGLSVTNASEQFFRAVETP